MTVVSIIQPNYIPWPGYFDIINRSDIFLYFDTVQYTKNDWRNRNRIKTPRGLQWLTIPVESGSSRKKIFETQIGRPNWSKKHYLSLQHNYSKAAYYNEISGFLRPLYLSTKYDKLTDAVFSINEAILNYLQIKTVILKASEIFKLEHQDQHTSRTDSIINICRSLGATTYLSGPSASNYINQSQFSEHNIQLEFIDYPYYFNYKQLWGGPSSGLSIVDLLFNCGSSSRRYLDGDK